MSTPATSIAELLPPGTVIDGKFRIVAPLGEGGMGVVMRAWHMHFEEPIAIKFLQPEMASNAEVYERFQRESRALFKIKSEHVCRVIDVGKTATTAGEVPYMVMELLNGHDLAHLLEHRQGQPIATAVDYVLQACEALSEAHVRGIVHRDIKPENIFLTQSADGLAHVKVLDFGLSKMDAPANSSGRRERTLTANEQVMGTPNYMSPEQWLSARDVAPESDQWSLAAILYELIAGVPPFEGEQLAQLCSQILSAPTPPLSARRPDVPPGLQQAIERALAKKRHERFADLGEFASALAPFGSSRARDSAQRSLAMFERADMSGSYDRLRISQIDMPPISASPSFAGDAAATQPQNAQPHPPRAQTAQSWSVHEPPSRTRFAVLGAVAVVLLVGVAGAVLWTNRADPPPAAGSAAAPVATVSATATADVEAAPSASAEAAEPAASASATATPTGEASAAAAPKPRKPVPYRRRRRTRRTAPKPTPKPATDIFSGRN